MKVSFPTFLPREAGEGDREAVEGAAGPPRSLAVTFIRFLLVGVANTGVGFGVILALQFGLGAAPHLANAGGYAVGLIVSFTLNRRFVFARGGPTGRTAARFGAAALAAFALNQGVLWVAARLLGPGSLAAVAAQAMAAASYTVTLFALCRGWVFRRAAALLRQSVADSIPDRHDRPSSR